MASSSNGTDVPPVLPSIPLAKEPVVRPADQSIGTLVREATAQVSTLVRAEVELARAEITVEVRKGLQGSVFFIVALVVALFSLFFLFFALGETLASLLGSRTGAFWIVFGLMILVAGVFGLLGYLRVRRIRKPEKTIESVRETAQVLSRRGHDGDHGDTRAPAPAQLDGSHRG